MRRLKAVGALLNNIRAELDCDIIDPLKPVDERCLGCHTFVRGKHSGCNGKLVPIASIMAGWQLSEDDLEVNSEDLSVLTRWPECITPASVTHPDPDQIL